MGKLLTKEDIAYGNHNFWWYYVSSFPGFDDEKEWNLDDAMEDVVDKRFYVPNFLAWYRDFCPEKDADEDGYFKNPNTIAGTLNGSPHFAVEFHFWHTTYTLNGRYIGNLGGHFETCFFTWEELLAFDKHEYLFLLMLPMVGIEKSIRRETEPLIAKKLAHISMFAGSAPYLAKCIANGLVMDGGFEQTAGVGITNRQNHSVRNILGYPRYKEDVVALNQALADFVKGS